jgi:hypothetical protein
LVVVVLVKPVFVEAAVTVAPATAALLASTTVPEICAVSDCPKAPADRQKTHAKIRGIAFNFFLILHS